MPIIERDIRGTTTISREEYIASYGIPGNWPPGGIVRFFNDINEASESTGINLQDLIAGFFSNGKIS